MPDPSVLTVLARLSGRMQNLEQNMRATRTERDHAIRTARGQGYGMPVIANAAGVSVATVKALTTGTHALTPDEYADPKAALFLRDQGVCVACQPPRKLAWDEWTPATDADGKMITVCLATHAEYDAAGQPLSTES